ncbi:MAG TPA: hypothetical protein VLD37_05025 [Candidatus Bilamarchaeum sp.]|nr:hypothetical protein [Candidatus Bilamarchaeum sp.]
MKHTRIPPGGTEEGADSGRRRRPSTIPPLSELPAGSCSKLSDAKAFELAYGLLMGNDLKRADALSDIHPELCAEIRKRNLMELLTHSLNVTTMNHAEVEAEIAEVFKRQLITSTPDEIKKLVSLIPALYTLPDFQHVKDKAQLAGIILTDDEVKKMCWVLRGYINHMNSTGQGP